MTGHRIHEFNGILNFRDLGGYPTRDGRTVRWRRLFRSAAPGTLNESDLSSLSSLGFRCVYDLRSVSEQTHQPSTLRDLPGPLYRAADHDEMPGDIPRLLRQGQLNPQRASELMRGMYRQLPLLLRNSYAALFQHVAADELPLLFNCAAGKDRTGVAAALLLRMLGVPHGIVVEDYLLSNHFFDRTCQSIRTGRYGELFTEADRAIWIPLVRCEPEYLQAMFDHLETGHGGVDGYLHELGVTRDVIETMRGRLLE